MDIEEMFRSLPPRPSAAERGRLTNELAEVINDMIQHRFSELVQWLYRVDVDENRVKKALQQGKERDAGVIIAELLIERQLQKRIPKKKGGSDAAIPDNERW